MTAQRCTLGGVPSQGHELIANITIWTRQVDRVLIALLRRTRGHQGTRDGRETSPTVHQRVKVQGNARRRGGYGNAGDFRGRRSEDGVG